MQILRIGICKDSRFKIQESRISKTCNLQLVTCNSRRAGFTLLELILVIFIVSLTLTLIMPSFWDIGEITLKTEARRIGGALRYIYDEAVGKKQTYVFNINLNDESWGFEGTKEKKKVSLKGNVEITDVLIPSLGEVSRGEVIIEFGPMGVEEPIILHLKKGKSEYTIIFNHLNGRTKIIEGYTI